MVKKRSFHKYTYLVFALIVLIISWESNKTNAAILPNAIPEEAIRLRILANSDSVQDQALKRLIRDAIVDEMNRWVTESATIEQARLQVEDHIPVFRGLIADLLQQRGFDYEFDVELGPADFPTKLYGSRVYPAGEYEALKITLGSGEGQNWWCVLFPPLCFVDVASGQAVAKEAESSSHNSDNPPQDVQEKDKQTGGNKEHNGKNEGKPDNGSVRQVSLQSEADREVRFFLWDLLQSLFAFIKGWFS
ncbi:stage II sporulation protein R [Paenibacillus sp. J2TS4]|uniref:stage II sporulation protein R n=1 Tax=Paenibacillus sp. J2TS4 TaxID=2807194 RepID=UPI001B1E8950|nr:stage II sporulation protein R [Paenibacillus sp. J2TS4]GIP35535.1 stage II sporulation protein R [Paenibacillus sp. J2TS4]